MKSYEVANVDNQAKAVHSNGIFVEPFLYDTYRVRVLKLGRGLMTFLKIARGIVELDDSWMLIVDLNKLLQTWIGHSKCGDDFLG